MTHDCTTNLCQLPIAYFDNVKDNTPKNQTTTWEQFQNLLVAEASRELARKEDANLYSPTVFEGKRCRANATISAMIVIDADEGLMFDNCYNALVELGLEAILYTTASNRLGDRFRIVIPLSEHVDPETYKQVSQTICRVLGGPEWKPDIGKIGPYNLFYLPGTYAEANNRFEAISGVVLSAGDWLELSPSEDQISKQAQPAVKAKPVEETWTTLAECPFVRGDWVDEYLSLGPGQWYRGLYKFMVRVAMSARAQGFGLTANQLGELAQELDRLDGGHYQDRDLDREAENALAFARTRTKPCPAAAIEYQNIWDDVQEPNEVDASEWQDNADDPGDEIGHDEFGTVLSEGEQAILDDSLPQITPLAGVLSYEFEDQLFSGRHGAKPKPAFAYLARCCIAVGDSYWVRTGGCWQPHTKATARAALIQQYLSVNTKPTITATDIKTFLADGIVRFHGTGVFPGSPQFVWFQGRRYLNIWVDERVRPDIHKVCSAEILLRIIRENLCGLDPISLAQMIDEAEGDEFTIFRWVMHWLASVYTRPGHHIGTALWFVGPNTGIGKGTIVGVLRKLLGPQWVGKASTQEMHRGWTDFLLGKLVLEADEFEVGSRTELNRLYKQWIGNDVLEVSKRHVGSFTIPNCINHVMTTNEIHPIQLDRNDRRHTLVHTSDDRSRNALAAAFHKLGQEERLAATQGLAAILASINIDDELISKPLPTDHRTALISWSASAVERWFATWDLKWVVGERRTAKELFQDFLAWAENDHRARTQVSNANLFGREMSKLEPNYVMKAKCSSITYMKVRYYDPATETILVEKAAGDALTDAMRERMVERGFLNP
jgi:hypothetical protein